MLIDLHVSDVLRASEVKRWQICATTRVQSLAEHTFNVICLSMVILQRRGGDEDTHQRQHTIMLAALNHDLPEVLCGDIPTPTKLVANLKPELDKIEAGIKFLGVSSQDFANDTKEIVKIADLVDACVYLHYYGVPCPHTRFVEEKILSRLAKFPEGISLYNEIINHAPKELGDQYGSW